jgi:hypothetical protein
LRWSPDSKAKIHLNGGQSSADCSNEKSRRKAKLRRGEFLINGHKKAQRGRANGELCAFCASSRQLLAGLSRNDSEEKPLMNANQRYLKV